MKQQMRRIAKSSRQEKKDRQSPVHANHSALPQSQVIMSAYSLIKNRKRSVVLCLAVRNFGKQVKATAIRNN